MVEELRKLKGYRQVSLPDALYREIEANLKKGGSFTSVADFIKYVVRKELEKGVSASWSTASITTRWIFMISRKMARSSANYAAER